MIFRVWIKIFLILFCVLLPLGAMQYFLQKESIELAFGVSDNFAPLEVLDSHLSLLKQMSKVNPSERDKYRKEFDQVVELKLAKQDLAVVKDRLISNLLRETLRNLVVILCLFGCLSLIISKSLVSSFKKLVNEIKNQSRRLEKLNSIESWQKIARVLVHELRSPITPIKLVSSDLENKYYSLPPEQFKVYLGQGAGLIQSQIKAIEKVMESFTRFSKLPDVKLSQQSISNLLNDFAASFSGYNDGQVDVKFTSSPLKKDILQLDSESLQNLLFNLIKNASEANKGENIKVEISVSESPQKTRIQVKNFGKTIPPSVAEKMFDLHVSTKKGVDHLNFGIGLTVSKKIALDHGGDLYLLSNENNTVVFELELPNL